MSSKTPVAVFSLIALLGLIGVSIWASGHQNILDAINDLTTNPSAGNNPWLTATLFDAYFGFLWFWCWVAWREARNLPRVVWLVLILLLGNIAMAAYTLLALYRLPKGVGAEGLFQKSRG